MRQWLDYKSARKETYKTEVGARKYLTMLQNLSGNNPQTAQLIIDKSIACNYAGLFSLKQQNTNTSLTCSMTALSEFDGIGIHTLQKCFNLVVGYMPQPTLDLK